MCQRCGSPSFHKQKNRYILLFYFFLDHFFFLNFIQTGVNANQASKLRKKTLIDALSRKNFKTQNADLKTYEASEHQIPFKDLGLDSKQLQKRKSNWIGFTGCADLSAIKSRKNSRKNPTIFFFVKFCF